MPRAAGGGDNSTEKGFKSRLHGLSVFSGSVIALIFGRLWTMQLVSTDEYTKQAELNRTRTISTAAPRGRILDRNVRPCRRDLRCELDVVAFIPGSRQVVFVEVKTHGRRSVRASRLWAIDRRKKRNIMRAGANWLMRRRWHGNFRFDVIEVYGRPGGASPEMDHIENVPLFPPNWRFW